MVRKKFSVKALLTDLVEVFIVSVVVFIVVYLYVAQLLEVTGQSMEPELHDKEQIIAEKISLKFRDLERQEIVIFKHPDYQNRLIVKRVIGLPGETIAVNDGHIYINDRILDEPYLEKSIQTKGGSEIAEGAEVTIPENEYVLLGDNRENSKDSRDWGPVSEDLIVGRAFIVYYPFSEVRLIED